MSHARETIVIKPPKGLAALDLRSLWEFRDLLFAFADRDIRLRYRQTVLGVAWVVLQPLMGAGVFAVVFGLIAKLPSQGVPYFLVILRGPVGMDGVFRQHHEDQPVPGRQCSIDP